MTQGFQQTQDSVESGLLFSVNQDMGRWLQLGVFVDDDWVSMREVFRFFKQYLTEYASLPHNSQLATRFNWNPPVGDFAYWLKEMTRYSLARKVLECIQDGFKGIADPDKALSGLIERLSLIRSQHNRHILATDASASERLDKFDARTQHIYNSNKMIGLRTGMKVIDDTLVGWTPGSLVGLYARPGVGKTWWLMWQGVLSWVDGATVLCIAPEMPVNMLSLRIDLIVGDQLGLPLDYGKLMVGNPDVRDNYAKVTAIMEQSKRWWTYDSLEDRALGLGDVAALIRQHEPSMVLIDGVSLLRSDNRGGVWEQMKDLCYGLKNLATIYGKPILVTHQAVNSARGRRSESGLPGRGDDFIMPSLNDAAFGDAFVQSATDILTMVAEPTSQNVNWYSIRKHRERGWKEPLPARMGLIVDFGRGKIYDVGHLGYDPQQVGNEARRILGI